MGSLKEKLSEAMKTAMKARDQETLGFARNLHAAVRKKEIDSKSDLDDAGVQAMVSTLMKQRKDSIEQFKKGGRQDLVEAEQKELKFLMGFMPAQLSEEKVRQLVEEAVAKSGAKEAKDLGKVMGILMPQVKGKADGKLVNQLVREKLGG